MVLDSVFAAAGNNDDVFDARRQALLDDVLNQGLIDNRKHLLGLGFRRGEKPSAQASGWENGFAHASALLCHVVIRIDSRMKRFKKSCLLGRPGTTSLLR